MLIKVERLDIGELEPTVHKAIIDLPNLDSIKEVSDDVVSNNQMDSDNNDDGNKPIAPLTNLKKNRTKHRCIVCSKYFQKKHRYDAHMRRHNGLKARNFVIFVYSVSFMVDFCRATSVNCVRTSLSNGRR